MQGSFPWWSMAVMSGITAGALNHDYKIDWLELNPQASHLLYRDKKQQLHLFDLVTQERITLLSFCSYVQWVPDSDVIVAQGEVEDIERIQGRTEVLVIEGSNAVSYVLDEALIEFGTALETLAFDQAVAILEPLQLAPETEAMWKQLAETALHHKELLVAERCYAALGDVARARYMHKVNKVKEKAIKELGIDGQDHFLVRARLALLQHQWKMAETLLLEHGQVDECIKIYTDCFRWKEAITVAESQKHPAVETLKQSHFEWLLETGQDEEAGRVKEAEGDILGAITLFMKE